MSGLTLVTRGFISPVSLSSGGGGGAVPMYRDDNLPKPFIKVIDFSMSGTNKNPISEQSIKVKSVKIIQEDKD